MNSNNKLNILKIPYEMWIILLGTLITNIAYFMVLPFITVILNQRYHLTPSKIGLVLSVVILISSFIGIYLGNLSDRIGRGLMLKIGYVISAIAFFCLGCTEELYGYFTCIMLIFLSRSIYDPLSKAIFGDIPVAYHF